MAISNINVAVNDVASLNVTVSFDGGSSSVNNAVVKVGTTAGSYTVDKPASAAPGTSIYKASFTAPTATFHFACVADREQSPDVSYTIVTPVSTPDALEATAEPEEISKGGTSTITATVTAAGQSAAGIEVKFKVKKDDDDDDGDDDDGDDDEMGSMLPEKVLTDAQGKASSVFTADNEDGKAKIKVEVVGSDPVLKTKVKVKVKDA